MKEFEIYIEMKDGKNESVKFIGTTKEALEIFRKTLMGENVKNATLRRSKGNAR